LTIINKPEVSIDIHFQNTSEPLGDELVTALRERAALNVIDVRHTRIAHKVAPGGVPGMPGVPLKVTTPA